MKANKRIRDLRRRSLFRLYTIGDRVEIGTTTCPTRENTGKIKIDFSRKLK